MLFETFIAISLTAVTVVLAVLAVLIAVLALWGYKAIKDEARAIAETSAKAVATSTLAEYMDGEGVQDKLKAEIKVRIEQVADRLFEDISMSTAFPQSVAEPDSPAVAEDYPEDE